MKMHKKLTDYQKADLWSRINIAASCVVDNSEHTQDLIEFRKMVEDLEEFLKKLTNHEIALAIEKNKTYFTY
jgi:hypothetical protein